ncbi:hypothetical protein Pint_00277 [Pistacia integerrima]|uniref:Uncharacterized protein n=1 Tax=Pistacia integerrima TaxID=434235 RepID=A0ACC0ZL29_9ROSI|nr:hypothetical protein Pint_00277 [Pistacia integerrima]
MTMEPQPLRSISSSHLGEEGGGGGPHKKEEEGSESIKQLAEEKELMKGGKAELTPAQLIEFQQQSLIFKHMKAGLHVPVHLVIPIWKSVASSFGSDIGGIYKQYPSFAGFSPRDFDCRNMKDPEPGRCRRTDGKKWRCGKNVIPDQKYCERHIHRGRQRSRKLVEASQVASLSVTTSAKDSENFKTMSIHSQSDPHRQSPSDPKISVAVSTVFQLSTPSSSTGNIILTSTDSKDDNTNDIKFSGISKGNGMVRGSIDSAVTIAIAAKAIPDTTISITSDSPVTISSPTVMTTTTNDGDNDVCGSKNSATTDVAAATTSSPAAASNPITGASITTFATATTFNNEINHSTGWKYDGNNTTSIQRMINRSSKSGYCHNSNLTAVVGFSPKSVLQVVGCSGSHFYRREIGHEPGRCRRTDGKKWRCSRDVVPDQKYCSRHMHRGAKKRVEAFQAFGNFNPVTSSVCLPHRMSITNEADSATLDTNLSISIAANPQLVNNDEKSLTGSSDATISDTNITGCEDSNISS